MEITEDKILHACEESSESEIPTPLEFAFELLGVNFVDQKHQLVSMVNDKTARTFFSEGWDSGLDYTLDDSSLPVDYKQRDESRAWLVGFVAGQYAGAHGYPSPTCLFASHQH